MQEYAVPTGAVSSQQYAGFWRRFAGLFVDGIIVFAITAVIGSLLFEPVTVTSFSTIISWAYQLYFLSQKGQTPGAMLLGIKLVDANGKLLTLGPLVVRILMAYVSGAVILIGYLWMLWDANKQTWHDKVANGYVVRV
jgi:uncharacterized RDD family membrane protein YckC